MARNFDYEANKRFGWEFTDKNGNFGPKKNTIYIYTDGTQYGPNPNSLRGMIIARLDICNTEPEAFFYKEEVPSHIKGGFYFGDFLDGYYIGEENFCTRNSNLMKSYLNTKKEVEKIIYDDLDGNEDAIKDYEDALNHHYDEVGAFCEIGGDENYFKRLIMYFIPYLKEIKVEKPATDFSEITCANTSEFCKALNSVKVEDKYNWLVAQTKKNDSNITCCGLEIKHTGRSTKVCDNRNYWVSFAPNSSKEWDVMYHNYIKSIMAA